MSSFEEAIAELNTIAVDLDRSGPYVAARIDKIVVKTAHDVEGYAKQIVPVDTGNLRSSITTTTGRDGVGSGYTAWAEIGPEASYGHFVEWGTHRQAPQAYMGPAADRYSGTFVAALAAASDPLDGRR
jgi:HK97 gp10 family phage protein